MWQDIGSSTVTQTCQHKNGSERESDGPATFTQLASPAEPRGTRRWLRPSAWPSTTDGRGHRSADAPSRSGDGRPRGDAVLPLVAVFGEAALFNAVTGHFAESADGRHYAARANVEFGAECGPAVPLAVVGEVCEGVEQRWHNVIVRLGPPGSQPLLHLWSSGTPQSQPPVRRRSSAASRRVAAGAGVACRHRAREKREVDRRQVRQTGPPCGRRSRRERAGHHDHPGPARQRHQRRAARLRPAPFRGGALTDGRASGGFTPQATGDARHANTPELSASCLTTPSACRLSPLAVAATDDGRLAPELAAGIAAVKREVRSVHEEPARAAAGCQATRGGLAAAPRGVSSARPAATTNRASTSPQRCPMCWGFDRDCAAMIPPCTMLDHTVNQIRLRCARGFREATTRNTPSVA